MGKMTKSWNLCFNLGFWESAAGIEKRRRQRGSSIKKYFFYNYLKTYFTSLLIAPQAWKSAVGMEKRRRHRKAPQAAGVQGAAAPCYKKRKHFVQFQRIFPFTKCDGKT